MIASIKVNVLMKRTAGPPGPSGELTYKNEVWKEMDAVTYLYIAGEYRLENREWSFNKYMEYHMANWSGLSVSQAANQLCKLQNKNVAEMQVLTIHVKMTHWGIGRMLPA